jgi:hypothetical protein
MEAVIKHTAEDNPDKQTLTQVVTIVREFLAKVNVETGKTENRFNLLQLDQQLVYRSGEQVVGVSVSLIDCGVVLSVRVIVIRT